MKLSLLVLTPGKMEGKTLEVTLAQFLVGRDPQCHLRPASPLISKRHCAIIQRDGKAFVRDFGSTNGTQVNDEPVQGERELHQDDQLKIGPLLFTVRLDTSAEVAPTAAKPTAGKTPVPATAAARPASAPTPTPAPAASKTPAPAGKSPAPAASKAPAASAKPSKAASKAEHEDDMMAMLMSLQEDGSSPVSEDPNVAIPDGSTVMDLKLPESLTAEQSPKKEEKPKDKKQGDTRSAAASILEKMQRRNRS